MKNIVNMYSYDVSRRLPENKRADVERVPENSKVLIKRSDSIAKAIFSILFSMLFLAGTIRHPQFIAWYESGAPTAPLFNEQLVLQFLPLFILLMALTLLLTALKLIKDRWSVSIVLAQALYSIFSAFLCVTFISNPDVFTEAFIVRFAAKVHVTSAAMSGFIHTGIIVVTVLIILGTLSGIISAINKTAKSYQ